MIKIISFLEGAFDSFLQGYGKRKPIYWVDILFLLISWNVSRAVILFL